MRKKRIKKNLTQMDVIVSLSIPRSLYLRYESVNNTPDIKLTNLIKLAEFFNVSIDYFVN